MDEANKNFQRRYNFPESKRARKVEKSHVPKPPEIIYGLLSQSEKGELCGGSKSYKTWTLIHQSLAVASQTDWLGFQTNVSNVLFLNMEIPEPFFDERVRTVAGAMGLDHLPDPWNVWHLRDVKLFDRNCWNAFLDEVKILCQRIPNPLVISDPIYKLLGGRNENAAGDVAELLSELDDMVKITSGANFFGHHFSKGLASEKEAIDRASGSGVFQRDPDSLMIMTAHDKEGAFTVEFILRNHPPVQSFVVEWNYPLFVRNDSLDPGELKKRKNALLKRFDTKIFTQILNGKPLNTATLKRRVMTETGMSKSLFYQLCDEAKKLGLIVQEDHTGLWERSQQTKP